jgi:hypothetical protein
MLSVLVPDRKSVVCGVVAGNRGDHHNCVEMPSYGTMIVFAGTAFGFRLSRWLRRNQTCR